VVLELAVRDRDLDAFDVEVPYGLDGRLTHWNFFRRIA
jgi:hypothetical protein